MVLHRYYFPIPLILSFNRLNLARYSCFTLLYWGYIAPTQSISMPELMDLKLGRVWLLLLHCSSSLGSRHLNKMDSVKIITTVFTCSLPSSVYHLFISGASFALLKKNAYPSQVFIGDTFCYFAGIVLCLAAIIGNSFF